MSWPRQITESHQQHAFNQESPTGALAALAVSALCTAQISDDNKIGLVVDLTSLYADVTGQG
jgi:hypothetical protein